MTWLGSGPPDALELAVIDCMNFRDEQYNIFIKKKVHIHARAYISIHHLGDRRTRGKRKGKENGKIDRSYQLPCKRKDRFVELIPQAVPARITKPPSQVAPACVDPSRPSSPLTWRSTCALDPSRNSAYPAHHLT